MRLVRYHDGEVSVQEAPVPALPPGGLLVRTEACGLCSGELMAWYMDRKADPVLGHEVAGKVIASDDARFPIGARVFPHHHAPCMNCDRCRCGAYVQCETWKRTRLIPGGMAEFFAVPKENLTDTHVVNDLRAIDAALIEPVSCVVKSLKQAQWSQTRRAAVIGLGNMGLMHMLALGGGVVGYELSEARRAHAAALSMQVRTPEQPGEFDIVFVCPGSTAALELAQKLVAPRGTILLFAPLGPAPIPAGLLDALYFRDVTLATSYSAGPDDTLEAIGLLQKRQIVAEQVVSDFVKLEELPDWYLRMKNAEILKAVVVFEPSS